GRRGGPSRSKRGRGDSPSTKPERGEGVPTPCPDGGGATPLSAPELSGQVLPAYVVTLLRRRVACFVSTSHPGPNRAPFALFRRPTVSVSRKSVSVNVSYSAIFRGFYVGE